ncbi:MAG: RidA family protein [Microthrixaceae bacterium]
MSALPYTPLFRAGDWACISGQIGIDDDGVVDGVEAQLRQILSNLDRLLGEHDVAASQIVKTTVFLVDMADYAVMNQLYGEYFGEHRPARSAVAVAELPFGARIELEAWAYLGD